MTVSTVNSALMEARYNTKQNQIRLFPNDVSVFFWLQSHFVCTLKLCQEHYFIKSIPSSSASEEKPSPSTLCPSSQGALSKRNVLVFLYCNNIYVLIHSIGDTPAANSEALESDRGCARRKEGRGFRSGPSLL